MLVIEHQPDNLGRLQPGAIANANFDAARFPRVLYRTCLRGTTPAA